MLARVRGLGKLCQTQGRKSAETADNIKLPDLNNRFQDGNYFRNRKLNEPHLSQDEELLEHVDDQVELVFVVVQMNQHLVVDEVVADILKAIEMNQERLIGELILG